jgi:hypothetical protein
VSPRVRFAVAAIAAAAVLFAVLDRLSAYWPALWSLELATAVIAVMLAAQGIGWRRKAIFVIATAALALALNEAALLSGLGAADVAGLNPGPAGPTTPQLLAVVAVQLLFVAVPLAALVLFVGRRPSVLWTAMDRAAPKAVRSSKKKRNAR